MRRSSAAGIFLAAGILACVLAAGCGQDDVVSYRVPKEPAPQAGSVSKAPPSEAGLHWSAPKGWAAKPPSAMRLASYAVPGKAGEADMSIVVLPGAAGGDFANVNRWRDQIGLPPLADDAALSAASTRLQTHAGGALVVDFAGRGEGSKTPRLLAAILPRGGETWFFKMTGPDETVAGAKPAFLQLLGSLR